MKYETMTLSESSQTRLLMSFETWSEVEILAAHLPVYPSFNPRERVMRLVELVRRDTLAFTQVSVEVEEYPYEDSPLPFEGIYESPNLPEDFDTVLGWLSRHRPDLIEGSVLDIMEATVRDGWWLCHRVRERDYPKVYVKACPAALENGIERLNAYPNYLIAERFANR
jgi:hypothetical protein